MTHEERMMELRAQRERVDRYGKVIDHIGEAIDKNHEELEDLLMYSGDDQETSIEEHRRLAATYSMMLLNAMIDMIDKCI